MGNDFANEFNTIINFCPITQRDMRSKNKKRCAVSSRNSEKPWAMAGNWAIGTHRMVIANMMVMDSSLIPYRWDRVMFFYF